MPRLAHPDPRQRGATTGFYAMGTEVRLTVHPARQIAVCETRVRACFREVEAAASRFTPHSELNRLARGELDTPSAILAELRHAADNIAELTAGLVTPFERRALEDAGYDVSFETIAQPRPRGAGPRTPFTEWGRLDFGGTGKGWTVDRALAEIASFCDGALLDAGGDIGAIGNAADAGPWWITIDGADPPARVAVRGGGVATSSTRRRTWLGPDGLAHHLIDPRLGRPAQSDVVQATAWARSTLYAEVAAKALVIDGLRIVPDLRRWFPEVVLLAHQRDGAQHKDPAFETEVLACA